MDFWMSWMRSPAGARAAAAIALCGLTAALQLSDMRYETMHSSLVPGTFVPFWGMSQGVGVLREDPSMAMLNRRPGQPVPLLLRDIPSIRSYAAVRVGIEAKVNEVTPGLKFWEAARVMLWSYDSSGARLRYLPYEVLRLEGSSDWRQAWLIVPVVPAVAAMRIVVVQAGQAGSMLVRGLTVDGVAESKPYVIARAMLIGLWIVVGLWCVVPLLRRRSRAHAVVALFLAAILIGAFTPQPLLSDSLHDVTVGAQGAVEPMRSAVARLTGPMRIITAEAPPVTIVTLETSPAPVAGSTTASAAAVGLAQAPTAGSAGSGSITLLADFSPQLGIDWGHLVAFSMLAAALPFAFPATPRWRVFAGLLLFGVAIEAVQSFYITRAAEWDDVAQDALGAALGLLATSAFLFWRDMRKRPA